jgi:hypothetical protein
MQLIIFLTHNFTEIFVNTLIKINNTVDLNNYKIIVLFDKDNNYDNIIVDNLKILKLLKLIELIRHMIL